MKKHQNCELCTQDGGELVYQNRHLRIVMVDDPNYPGYCRVIWQQHANENTDLSAHQRNHLMEVVWQLELVIREVLRPEKINLASFGNMTPHVHWHVIPRFVDDAHFPNSVWGQQQRQTDPAVLAQRVALLPHLRDATVYRLALHFPSE